MNMHAISTLTSLATIYGREPSFYRHNVPPCRTARQILFAVSSRSGARYRRDGKAWRSSVHDWQEMIAGSSVFW